jgi:hypothetical protein
MSEPTARRAHPFALLALGLGLCLPVASTVAGQEVNRTFPVFRLQTTHGTHISGWEGELTANTLLGKLGSGDALVLPRAEIRRLEYLGGSRTGQFALVGAGFGGLLAGLGILQAMAQEEIDPTIAVEWRRARLLTVGFVVVGTGIGALVGSKAQRWVPVDLDATHNSRGNAQ